jgi:hypothetical protein
MTRIVRSGKAIRNRSFLSFDLSAIFSVPELAMRKGSADNDRGYLAVINHLVETGDDTVHHGHTDPPPTVNAKFTRCLAATRLMQFGA